MAGGLFALVGVGWGTRPNGRHAAGAIHLSRIGYRTSRWWFNRSCWSEPWAPCCWKTPEIYRTLVSYESFNSIAGGPKLWVTWPIGGGFERSRHKLEEKPPLV